MRPGILPRMLARRYAPYVILAALALLCLGIWSAASAETPKRQLTVAVLDVGQGDSLYIESPTGVQLIIDGGPDGSLLHELADIMPYADRSLDAVIETHPDADHIAGLVDIVSRYSVGVFIEPGIPKDTVTARTLNEEIDEAGIPRVLARRGMWVDLGGGARLDILYPDFDTSTLPASKSNEGGIVARLTYASSTMLFMADVSGKVEARLMALDVGQLDSDVLKVGHHGSRTSTLGEFVSAVSPELAVISVGKNSYGHPTPDVLERLAARGVRTLRTDQEGTIILVSDGKGFVRK